MKAPRVGRSQGAVIFWGLVSAFFASAFCYYYLKNRTNEEAARALNDQVMILQGERDSLSSERDKVEAATSDAQKQLRAREDFLQEKETKLAEEESEIEASSAGGQLQQSQAQAAGVKHFDEIAHKLAAGATGSDVVPRGGRPVLRVPSSVFFAPGDARLKADGKEILRQAAQAVGGGAARFELRVETFSDSGSEGAGNGAGTPSAKKDDAEATGQGAADAGAKTPHYTSAWDLTAARAEAIARYLHDLGALPFQNVFVLGRGDTLKDGHAHDRRVEITLSPVPPMFHAPEPAKAGHGKPDATPAGKSDTATAP